MKKVQDDRGIYAIGRIVSYVTKAHNVTTLVYTSTLRMRERDTSIAKVLPLALSRNS